MHMAVDQAGHYGFILKGDQLIAGPAANIPFAYIRYPAAIHNNGNPGLNIIRDAVDKPAALDVRFLGEYYLGDK